jgi:glycosyltransferase involved in cell wall biosynthesis
VEAASFYLAQGLREIDDIDLHVFAATKQVDSDRLVSEPGLTAHFLAEPRRRVVPNLVSNIERYRRAIDEFRPDIVHGEHPCAALAGVKGGYPTVLTIHGVIHRERRYNSGGPLEQLNWSLFNYITRKAIATASHVLPVSSYVSREYGGIIRGGVTVVPNAVDDSFFGVSGDEISGRLLYVGYIGARKNLLGLVRAFERIHTSDPSAELRIAGGVSDRSYAAAVHDCVRTCGLEDSVRFLGLLDQDQLIREHAEASVVCIFSSHETFSLTVSQGMAAGKPVVSTDSGGPSDLIEDGETGYLVPVGDEEAFADRCLRLLSDEQLRRRMGARGREVAREMFAKESVARRTVEVYKELLNR